MNIVVCKCRKKIFDRSVGDYYRCFDCGTGVCKGLTPEEFNSKDDAEFYLYKKGLEKLIEENKEERSEDK